MGHCSGMRFWRISVYSREVHYNMITKCQGTSRRLCSSGRYIDHLASSSNSGKVWRLLALAVYAAVEIGKALHGVTCDEHEGR